MKRYPVVPLFGKLHRIKADAADLRDLWHFHFYGEVPLALVKGRERIYFEHFWNDFAADPKRSVAEADRRIYAKAYAQPDGMRAGFEYFKSFERDAKEFAELGATPLLCHPREIWDFFWRDSTRDAIYGNGVNVVVPAGSSRDRYVGNQFQVLAEWQWHLVVTAAYAHFFARDFLETSTPGKDVNYASIWLTFRF